MSVYSRGRQGPKPEPVFLHVYDLNPQNDMLYGLGLGAYHSGVVIGTEEWTYGGSPGEEGGGIFSHSPKNAGGAPFREAIFLGEVSITSAEFKAVIDRLKPDWQGRDYNLLTHNCNHFSDALVRVLLGRGIPGWVNRMSGIGSAFSCCIPRAVTGQAPVREGGGAAAAAGAARGGSSSGSGSATTSAARFHAFGGQGQSLSSGTASSSSAGGGASSAAGGAGGSGAGRGSSRIIGLASLGSSSASTKSGAGAAGASDSSDTAGRSTYAGSGQLLLDPSKKGASTTSAAAAVTGAAGSSRPGSSTSSSIVTAGAPGGASSASSRAVLAEAAMKRLQQSSAASAAAAGAASGGGADHPLLA